MSYKKQTDLNVITFCTILKKHQLKSGSRLHQHLLCSIVLVTTIWVHIIGVDNSKPIYKTEFSPFGLSVLFLDGLGKGIHHWFWGDSSPVLKNLKFLWIPLALLRLFIFLKFKINIFLEFTPNLLYPWLRPLLTQNDEWVEIPTDDTNSKILATFI